MNTDNFYKLLFELYASQENLKIKYTVDGKFFSTESHKKKRFKTI